jgi:hypothetical protein
MNSDEEIFLTQNKFREGQSSEEDTDSVLNDILDFEDKETPQNFDVKFEVFSDLSDDDTGKTIMEAQKDNHSVAERRSREEENTRFVSDSDGQRMSKSRFSTKTELKTKWATDLFHSWLRKRQEKFGHSKVIRVVEGDLLSMDLETLSYSLGVFITEVRKENGDDYRSNTLYEIIIAIQHHLRKNGRLVTLMDDVEFEGMRNILNKRMKDLVASSIGIERKQSEFITKAKFFPNYSLRAKGETQTYSAELPAQLGSSCTSVIQKQKSYDTVQGTKRKHETVTCEVAQSQCKSIEAKKGDISVKIPF